MIVEVEIDTATLVASFREQMRQKLACQLVEFPVGEVREWITGYEIGDTRLRRSQADNGEACAHVDPTDPGKVTKLVIRTIELVQHITVFTCGHTALVQANGGIGPIVPIQIDVIFTVETDSCGSMRNLCFRYATIDPYLSEVDQAIRSLISPNCIALPIDSVLKQAVPQCPRLINSHMILGPNDKSVVIRMEFWDAVWESLTGESAKTLPYWQRFYAGVVAQQLQPNEQWAVFVDQSALVYQARALVKDSFTASANTRLRSGPFGSWSNNGGVGRISVKFNGDSIDACRCVTKEIDVNADVTLDIDMSVPRPNTLRQDVWLDVSPNFWDSACCVATATMFWPIVGAEQLKKENINEGEYLLGFLPFVALVGALVQVLGASSKLDPPTDFTKDDEDGDHLFREQPLILGGDPSFGTMTLTSARPVDESQNNEARGLLTAGTVTIRTRRLPTLADIERVEFSWGSGSRCSNTLGVHALFDLEATLPGDQALLSLCGFEVIDDPLGVFRKAVTYDRDSGNRHWLRVGVPIHALTETYFRNPYPCRIVVRTNGGIRIVSITPPERLSIERVREMEKEIQIRYVNDCQNPKHKIFEEREWRVDPPMDKEGAYVWQIDVKGLGAAEHVRIVDSGGKTLGVAIADTDGAALLTALASVKAADPALTVIREVSREHGFADVPQLGMTPSAEHAALQQDMPGPATMAGDQYADRSVTLRQTRLLQGKTIPISGRCRQILPFMSGRSSVLIAVTSGLVEAFDVDHTDQPALAWSAGIPGARGIVDCDGGLYVWGDRGIGLLTQSITGRVRSLVDWSDETPVRRAICANQRLWILGDGQLVAHDLSLAEVGRIDAEEASDVLAIGSAVVLVEAGGIRIVDGNGSQFRKEGKLQSTGEARRVAAVPALGPRPLLALIFDDHVDLVRLGNETLEPAGRYGPTPWFLDVVRFGRWMAAPTRDRRAIALVEAVATALD
ncbi:hypothetical protein ACWEO2_18390 [Nocardia sp. NPDC004278]